MAEAQTVSLAQKLQGAEECHASLRHDIATLQRFVVEMKAAQTSPTTNVGQSSQGASAAAPESKGVNTELPEVYPATKVFQINSPLSAPLLQVQCDDVPSIVDGRLLRPSERAAMRAENEAPHVQFQVPTHGAATPPSFEAPWTGG